MGQEKETLATSVWNDSIHSRVSFSIFYTNLKMALEELSYVISLQQAAGWK